MDYESNTILSFDTFIPVFIQTNNDLTRISTPLVNADNKFKIDNLADVQWRFLKKLWTFNLNILPPLPPRTNIYTIKTAKNFPYNSISIETDLRPYFNPPEDVNFEYFKFVAYSLPLEKTIPLFIYQDSQGIIFSLQKKDLSKNISSSNFSVITEHILSPIFMFDQNFNFFEVKDKIIIPTNDSSKYNNLIDAISHITRELKSPFKINKQN